MRLWSIHPKYLDRQGLLAVWREGLLAQSVLSKGEYTTCPDCGGYGFGHCIPAHSCCSGICIKCKGTGKIKTPYYMHPQLERFKKKPIESLKNYLYCIYEEAKKRGYNFDAKKINLDHDDWIVDCPNDEYFMEVTQGQLVFEMKHLQKKLKTRCPETWGRNDIEINQCNNKIEAHPLFTIIEGNKEQWERG